jgi:hypothetical protein
MQISIISGRVMESIFIYSILSAFILVFRQSAVFRLINSKRKMTALTDALPNTGIVFLIASLKTKSKSSATPAEKPSCIK